MFHVSKLLLQIFPFVCVCPAAILAQPQVPEHPASRQECSTFSDEYHNYLNGLQAEYRVCDAANQGVPVAQWRSGYRCSTGVHVPPACVELSNQWDCAIQQYSSLQSLCASRIVGNRNANGSDDPSRKALQNAGGSLASRTALRAAKFLIENGKNEDAKALLAGAQTLGKYADAAQATKAVSNSNLPAEKRIELLTKLGANTIKNPLAADLTKTALQGVTNTNKGAITAFQSQLQQFSNQASQKADQPADKTSNERRLAREKINAVISSRNAKAEEELDRLRVQSQRQRESIRRQEEVIRQQEYEANYIPPGWFECRCPYEHSYIGKVVGGIRYHGPGPDCS
jgi:hypothetical protein